MAWSDPRTQSNGAAPQPQTDTDSAILAGLALSAAGADPEEQHFVIVPRNSELTSIEEYRDRPRRIKTTAQLADVESFLKYLDKFKSDATVILTNARAVLAKAQTSRQSGDRLPDVHVTAHFDYHKPDAPSWNEHKAQLDLIRTREWLAWTGINKKHMNQAQLCEFFEENMPDIIQPDSARLLEMIRQFEVKKEINFQSARNLQNGDVQFLYEENSRGTTQKGTVEIPESLTIGVRVFEGMELYKIPAKLRWRLFESKLELWLDLQRWHVYERDALDLALKQIAQATDAPIFQVSGSDD